MPRLKIALGSTLAVFLFILLDITYFQGEQWVKYIAIMATHILTMFLCVFLIEGNKLFFVTVLLMTIGDTLGVLLFFKDS